jgi:hypothetical protein
MWLCCPVRCWGIRDINKRTSNSFRNLYLRDWMCWHIFRNGPDKYVRIFAMISWGQPSVIRSLVLLRLSNFEDNVKAMRTRLVKHTLILYSMNVFYLTNRCSSRISQYKKCVICVIYFMVSISTLHTLSSLLALAYVSLYFRGVPTLNQDLPVCSPRTVESGQAGIQS